MWRRPSTAVPGRTLGGGGSGRNRPDRPLPGDPEIHGQRPGGGAGVLQPFYGELCVATRWPEFFGPGGYPYGVCAGTDESGTQVSGAAGGGGGWPYRPPRGARTGHGVW